jgi:hypothetical protein
MTGFDLNSFCDSFDDGYGVFDDIVDSLDFRAVGMSTVDPSEGERKKVEDNKKKNAKLSPVNISLVKRGRKPGQKPTCSTCGVKGHTKRKCVA